MATHDKVAADFVRKMRSELIFTRKFYGVLVSNVEPVERRDIPTMGTDGRRHYYNPDYIKSLPPRQRLGVQAHESEHDARKHPTRRGNRDPKKWNIACDFAINIDLIDEGFELPPDVYVDRKYKGWSAEDIYRARELDEQRAEQERRKREQEEREEREQEEPDEGETDQTEGDGEQEPDEGDGEPGDDGEAGDDATDEAESDEGEGDEGGTDEDANGEPDEGSNGSDGDADGEDAEGDSQGEASGEDAGEDDGDSQGEGQGNADRDGEGETSESEGEPTSEAANGKAIRSCGDPGMCGEVFDAAEDAADMAEIDSRWERIVRQAATVSGRGNLPGHWTREIERADKPPQDWRNVLRQFIDGGARVISTWNRPNRRFVGSGMILPGNVKDGVNKVVVCIDTSGSMDDIALACVQTEVQAALDDGAINELIVIYGDTRVTRVDEYHEGDQLDFDPRGGGGTDLQPMFQYVAENISDVSLMIVFTDMYIGEPGPAPACPALFCVTGYPDIVREHLKNIPWGAEGIDVGSH